jgi:hypothetical protein
MAILLVTYDLKQPGQDYKAVHAYLRQFMHCKEMESVWLLDTNVSTATIRDSLRAKVDPNDVVFVVRITSDWGSWNYRCADWLNAGRHFMGYGP